MNEFELEEKVRMLEDDLNIAEFELLTEKTKATQPIAIASNISFHNSHEIAHHLYHTDKEAAQALYDELASWFERK